MVSAERSVALARLFRLLESARPADAKAVVSQLSGAELAAAVEAAQGRISLPIREYILTEGPSCALAALAREAVLGRGEGPDNAVDRILLRCDPEADAAFFHLDPDLNLVARARRMILRDRKGPDGHAVIPAPVKQCLLDTLAAAGPGGRLLADLAAADDPDLVLAAASHARKLHASQAASIITTLAAHGRRAEAKRHRELWIGRGANFTILGFRRFAVLPYKYALGTDFTPVRDANVEAVSVEQYRERIEHHQKTPGPAAFSELRKAALVALQTGTMTASEVLEHTRPAALALTMAAACAHHGDGQPAQRRVADDLRLLIASHASEQLGRDPKRWARAVARANTFGGTVLGLLTDPDSERDTASDSGRVPRVPMDFSIYVTLDVDAANILLALAPRGVAERALLTRGAKRWITILAGGAPLCRALVEHIVTRGTVPQRERLAANEVTPDAVLERLMCRSEKTDIMLAIMDRDGVGREIAECAYAKAPRGRDLKDWIADRADVDPAAAMAALRGMADDPAWIVSVLRFANFDFGEPVRVAAYTLLAELAGVEAVWALELDRTESLETMAPYVRATMATGDTVPLAEAARTFPLPGSLRDAYPYSRPMQVTEEDVDHPLSRPLEDAVRTRLDGRVDRWLDLAGRLEADARTHPADQQEAGVPLADLIRYWPDEV